jgi:hypothetical protein
MHALVRLGLLLLLWLPALASAQPEQTPAPASDAPTLPPLVTAPPEPEAPPKGELIPRRSAPAANGPDLFVPRILLSPLLGGLATSCGALVGLLLGLAVSPCNIFDGACNGYVLAIPTVLGGWAAGSLSVYGMGGFFGGQGRLGPTMIGGALGMGAAIALAVSVPEAGWVTVPLSPALGAVIGYEISHAQQKGALEQDEEPTAGLLLMPTLGRTPEGGILGGLAGRF